MSEADQADILTPPEQEVAPAPAAPPEEFPFVTLPPQVSFATGGVMPPSEVYLGTNDWLTLQAWTSISGLELRLFLRVLRADGQIIQCAYDYWPQPLPATNAWTVNVPEGFLLGGFVGVGGTCPTGGCYIRLNLGAGSWGGAGPAQVLLKGYVPTNGPLSWPYPRHQNPVEGPGRLRRIKGTDPGPGNIIMEYVPSGTRWKLISLFCTFTTSATAGNRAVYLYFLDSLGLWLAVPPGVLQPASSVAYYTWSIGVQNYTPAVALYYAMPLPADLYLQAGADIMVAASGMQAGDDFSAPQLLVEEWVEP
jgi:hypothetical protein